MQHAEAKLVAKKVAEPYTCIDIYQTIDFYGQWNKYSLADIPNIS